MRFEIPWALLLCALPFGAIAQKNPMKWGDVPKEDLDMKVLAADTSAEAYILTDFGDLTFEMTSKGPRCNLDRHRRIKILKREGFEFGDVAILYNSFQNNQKVQDLDAQIILPDGKTVALRGKDFFEEEVDKRRRRIRFTFPNMQEGAVIEYRYRIINEDIFSLPEWYFQTSVPVRWSEFRLHIPKWYHYVTLTQGRKFDMEEHGATDGTIFVQNNTATGSNGNVTVKIHNHRYVMKDMPALKEEAFVTTMDDYRARIRFQLSGTEFDVFKPVLTSWDQLAEELMTNAAFGEQFTKSRHFKDIVDAASPYLLLAPTPDEKIRLAYQFLARQMQWDENYGIFVRGSLNDCFKQKKAHSGELNLMFIALLREHGIDAVPMLVSTRDNGQMVETYPIFDQFNHVLAMVPVGGKYLPVDLGTPFRPMGTPRVNSLNSKGWIVAPGKSQWLELNVPETKEVIMADIFINEQGEVQGRFKFLHSGYSAVNEREAFAEDKDGKHLLESLREHFPEAVMDSFRTEKLDDIHESLIVNLHCHIPAAASVAGDLIYLSPVLIPAFDENPFRVEQRLFPVDIPYPFSEQYVMNINVPDGYAIEELPVGVNLVTENDGARYQFMVQKKSENQIQVVSRLYIKQLHFAPEYYGPLREIFSRLVQKQGEQIVLKKKT